LNELADLLCQSSNGESNSGISNNRKQYVQVVRSCWQAVACARVSELYAIRWRPVVDGREGRITWIMHALFQKGCPTPPRGTPCPPVRMAACALRNLRKSARFPSSPGSHPSRAAALPRPSIMPRAWVRSMPAACAWASTASTSIPLATRAAAHSRLDREPLRQ
jgi:hypothetical protein